MDPTMENKKATSSSHEHAIAKYLGWGVVKGSGSRPTYTGDIIGHYYLGECKTHMKPQPKVEFLSNVWLKICKEAQAKHRMPALFSDSGSQSPETTLVMFPEFAVPFDSVQIISKPVQLTEAGNVLVSVESAESELAPLRKVEPTGTTLGAYKCRIQKLDVLIMRCADFKLMLEE